MASLARNMKVMTDRASHGADAQPRIPELRFGHALLRTMPKLDLNSGLRAANVGLCLTGGFLTGGFRN